MLEKQTQQSILDQSEKRVRMNDTVTNTGDLETDGLKVVQSLTMALQMRLDKS